MLFNLLLFYFLESARTNQLCHTLDVSFCTLLVKAAAQTVNLITIQTKVPFRMNEVASIGLLTPGLFMHRIAIRS